MREVVVEGAREHNLKGVDLRFPRDSLVVFTGVSGSGKSSLAYDTIFREGQRRYLASLSAYARQFLGGMEKPKVDRIEGLSPTVAIHQKSVSRNPRSTVGTVTEIWDFLRLLMARLGVPHCPTCGREVVALAPEEIADRVLEEGPEGERILVLAPVVRGRKGSYRKELEAWKRKGWVRARIDGRVHRLDEEIHLHRYKKHDISLVVDRLRIRRESRERLLEALALAMAESGGAAGVLRDSGKGEVRLYSSLAACPEGHGSLPELEPVLFSFNSPKGACRTCEGLGEIRDFDPERILGDPGKSLRDGALLCVNKQGFLHYTRFHLQELDQILAAFGASIDRPLAEFPRQAARVLWNGAGDRVFTTSFVHEGRRGRVKGENRRPFPGVLGILRRVWSEFRPPSLARFQRVQVCGACGGARLGPEALAVTFEGRNLRDLSSMTLAEAEAWFREAATRIEEEGGRRAAVGRELFREVLDRLDFLGRVGLGYLRIDRPAGSLSGGEAQRIRLAAQVGSGLRGVLYVLDEPSIGLHARDNERLLETLAALKDRGNTVCVVEHDEETMLAADWLVDIGPAAGVHGGKIVASGPPSKVRRDPRSLTARYLRGERRIEIPPRRPRAPHRLRLRGARKHNLKKIDLEIPLERFVCVSGVSGSGKSSLVHGVLKPALVEALGGEPEGGERCWTSLQGAGRVTKVFEIDQSPIGRTPRSNPATYTGLWTLIRDLFASLPESRMRGYAKGRFSFNVEGGRCAVCEGAGVRRLEMQFLEAVEVRCEACEGTRFQRETLEIQYRGRNIHDILEMTIEEASDFFENHPRIRRILEVCESVGLGYLRLGQTSTTLSGGEAQRVKLASKLARPGGGGHFYILDEPTTGLHFEDVRRLLDALQALVDRGDTVLVIEHNLDVLKSADWILDLGPEGGEEGGRLVAAGTPEEIAACPASRTGKALLPKLSSKGGRPPRPGRRRKRRSAGRDLRVRGARIHNLAGLDARIPSGSLTVVTGVSGSGKSSLAFDTLFREGQRRFLESLSTYARRFLGRMERAPVDRIEGLLPAIAIDQRGGGRSPRSTVGTSTEVLDHLRLLFARAGVPHCPEHRVPLLRRGPSVLAAEFSKRWDGCRGVVLAPSPLPVALEDADFREVVRERLDEWRQEGFARFAIGGERRVPRLHRLEEDLPVSEFRKGLMLVVDRLRFGSRSRSRLAEGLELAGHWGGGVVALAPEGERPVLRALDRSCPHCGFHLPLDLHPRFFSFNHHSGACPECEGLGVRMQADLEALIADPAKPLFHGAFAKGLGPGFSILLHPRRALARTAQAMAEAHGFDLDRRPWNRLTERQRRLVLEGTGERRYPVEIRRGGAGRTRRIRREEAWPGLRPFLEERLLRLAEPGGRASRVLRELPCPHCRGSRLSPAALAVTVGGANLPELCARPVSGLRAFLDSCPFSKEERRIAAPVLRELEKRLSFLEELGLGYLTMDRSSGTLSGGEAQRIRLAGQLGSRLTGTLYVLDEPTIGLHPKDTEALLDSLCGLRDAGNTVLAVEHDEAVIERSDWILDLGPGAGKNGGRLCAQGPIERIRKSRASPTGAWLSGRRSFSVPERRRKPRARLRLSEVSVHNLKGCTLDLPVGCMTAVTGVSGSGKSSLVLDALVPALRGESGPWRLEERAGIRETIVVDQEPIGSTPRSCPATYLGIWTPIRELFARTEDARRLGFGPGRFSFNAKEGRCPACEGLGQIRIEMHFLPDVWVPCDLCGGRRYDEQTLQVKWRGKDIAEVCRMEVVNALEFFHAHRRIAAGLRMLQEVGLGYLELGQGVQILSGGEAQRLKLAAELCRPPRRDRLYVCDEPTTGLHMEDVERLLRVLRRLVEGGATVLIVEHQMDVVKTADHVVDLGPGSGEEGGRILAAGTPEEVAACPDSATAPYLRRALEGKGAPGSTGRAGGRGAVAGLGRN